MVGQKKGRLFRHLYYCLMEAKARILDTGLMI
jgi:hypothetical protein